MGSDSKQLGAVGRIVSLPHVGGSHKRQKGGGRVRVEHPQPASFDPRRFLQLPDRVVGDGSVGERCTVRVPARDGGVQRAVDVIDSSPPMQLDTGQPFRSGPIRQQLHPAMPAVVPHRGAEVEQRGTATDVQRPPARVDDAKPPRQISPHFDVPRTGGEPPRLGVVNGRSHRRRPHAVVHLPHRHSAAGHRPHAPPFTPLPGPLVLARVPQCMPAGSDPVTPTITCGDSSSFIPAPATTSSRAPTPPAHASLHVSVRGGRPYIGGSFAPRTNQPSGPSSDRVTSVRRVSVRDVSRGGEYGSPGSSGARSAGAAARGSGPLPA